jgi:hypothetical protein
MGGKMNLNPLKKDDNTDALVKALEDANAADQPQVGGMPTPDGAAIAADPQVVSAGTTPVVELLLTQSLYRHLQILLLNQLRNPRQNRLRM